MPKDVEEKKQIINTIYDKALSLGMAHEDIVVDGLVATIGANPKAAIECYETIAYCKDEKSFLQYADFQIYPSDCLSVCT